MNTPLPRVVRRAISDWKGAHRMWRKFRNTPDALERRWRERKRQAEAVVRRHLGGRAIVELAMAAFDVLDEEGFRVGEILADFVTRRPIDECPVDACERYVPGVDAGEVHEGSRFMCDLGHELVAVVDDKGRATLQHDPDDEDSGCDECGAEPGVPCGPSCYTKDVGQ